MDFKKLTDKAKRTLDERGGTERLKQDAERLRNIASGPGSARDKAKAAGEALKQPGANPRPADSVDPRQPGNPGY